MTQTENRLARIICTSFSRRPFPLPYLPLSHLPLPSPLPCPHSMTPCDISHLRRLMCRHQIELARRDATPRPACAQSLKKTEKVADTVLGVSIQVLRSIVYHSISRGIAHNNLYVLEVTTGAP